MVRRSNAHNLSAKVNAPKTKTTSSKKEAQAKEDPYAKFYISKREHRAQRKAACEIRVDEDEKDNKDNKDIKLLQQQIAKAAAALKASVVHDDSAPSCNAIPYAPDTTMQHEDMVQPEIKIETPTFVTPIPQGQPGWFADDPIWDELEEVLVAVDQTPDEEFDTPCDTIDYQHHTTQHMTVVEGQAGETTEYHTEQQTTYMQQGFMPMQHADERPVDHFDITEFVDFSSDYEVSENEA